MKRNTNTNNSNAVMVYNLVMYAAEGRDLAKCLTQAKGNIPVALKRMAKYILQISQNCHYVADRFDEIVTNKKAISIRISSHDIEFSDDQVSLEKLFNEGILAKGVWRIYTSRFRKCFKPKTEIAYYLKFRNTPSIKKLLSAEYDRGYFRNDCWPAYVNADGSTKDYIFGNYSPQGFDFKHFLKKSRGNIVRALRAWGDRMLEVHVLYVELAERMKEEIKSGHKFRFLCMSEFCLLYGDEDVLDSLARDGFLCRNDYKADE